MNLIEVKLVRGFTEIQRLFEITKNLRYPLHICGGYARYCASLRIKPTPPEDIDLFCEFPESFEPAKQYFLSENLIIEYENDVCITFGIPSNKEHKWRTTPKIQLIKPFQEGKMLTFGRPSEILENFDMTIVRACILDPNIVLVDEDFVEDELNTRICLRNIHCPISSMFRAVKYMRRGYFLSPIESIKLFIDWEQRTPEYRAKVIDFVYKIQIHKETGESTLSEKDIWELERLMKID